MQSRLLSSIALIAAGISAFTIPLQIRPDWFRGPIVGLVLVASGMVDGAGIGVLFKRPGRGAFIGFCFVVALIIFGQSPRD